LNVRSAKFVAELVALLIWAPAATCAAETAPRVVYAPPLLSVEAVGVALPDLLREIGQRAGFEIVSAEVPRPPVSLKIQGATLEEVLRQLLRNEDHVIVYRENLGTSRVETVVLRGPQGPAAPASAMAGDWPLRRGVAAPQGGVQTLPPVTVQPAARPFPQGVVAPSPPSDTGAASTPPSGEVSGVGVVEDLLASQAMAGLKRARPAASTAPPTATAEALARTTRTAQQSLKALMDRLEAVTESMRASGALPPR